MPGGENEVKEMRQYLIATFKRRVGEVRFSTVSLRSNGVGALEPGGPGGSVCLHFLDPRP